MKHHALQKELEKVIAWSNTQYKAKIVWNGHNKAKFSLQVKQKYKLSSEKDT